MAAVAAVDAALRSTLPAAPLSVNALYVCMFVYLYVCIQSYIV